VTSSAGVRGDDPALSTKRHWHVGLLTETEPGRRNRRTIDSVLLFWAALVIGLTAAVAASAPTDDRNVGAALTTVFGWAGALWRAAFFALLASAAAIVVDALLERRWDLVRDLLVAVAGVLGTGFLLGGAVESDWVPFQLHPLARWGYPEVRLAAATAAVVVAGPELIRSVRLVAGSLVPLAALGSVVLGAALPSAALAGVALGLAAGSLARLIFGSAAGVPPTQQIQAALISLGVDVDDLKPSLQQHVGAAEYIGHAGNGDPLRVRVLGRDAQDTQRLAREWRLLSYKDPPRSAPAGRLEQVEHQALATLMAAQAGVRVPAIVIAALGPDGDALIVTREPTWSLSRPTATIR
jgi:glycosyltransferase 2 family protein